MADTVTKGGIMLPEKSQGKVLQATVVAVGPGSVNQVTTLFFSLVMEKICAGFFITNIWDLTVTFWFRGPFL